MKIRSVLLASACAALLAASAAATVGSAEKATAIGIADAAYKSLVSGRTEDAIQGFSEAIESRKLPPDLLANSLMNRALAYQNTGRPQDAINDYTAALRVDALSGKLRALALYNRGLAYQKLEKPALAIEDFTSALFLDMTFAQSYYSRGDVLRRNGQFLFALTDYEQALKHRHPAPHLVYYGQALTYEALSQPQLAQQSLAQAIRLKPDFALARHKLNELAGTSTSSPADDATAQALQTEGAVIQTIANDQIVTGTLATGSPDLVMRKAPLPPAESPPSDMLGMTEQLAVNNSASEETEEQPAASEAPPAEEPEKVAAVEAKEEIAAPQETAAEAPAPKLEGWMVQLSSQRDEPTAWAVWEKLNARHGKLLKGRDAAVVKAELEGRGTYYRLRIHNIDSREAAQKLCAQLKSRGTSCFFGPAAAG